MKTTLINTSKTLIALLVVIGSMSCSKEDPAPVGSAMNYSEIKFSDIKAKASLFSTDGLIVSDVDGIYFKSGDILLFKTSMGNYGKMEVVSVDAAANYCIYFKATVYLNNGTMVNETSSTCVRGTWLYDLDEMEEIDALSSLEDFWNERLNATDTHLVPKNDASFIRLAK